MGLYSGYCLYNTRCLSLIFVAKCVIKDFRCMKQVRRKGQRLDQDKGPLLVTWTSPVYLPSPFQYIHRQSRQAGIMCLSLVGGNMKTFIQKQKSGASKSGSNLLIYLSDYHRLQTNPNTITSLSDQCVRLLCDVTVQLYGSQSADKWPVVKE